MTRAFSYATDTLPARQVRNHGERQQYYAEATHPPIIEKEIFFAAQELKSRWSEIRRRGIPADSPLQRRISCGICGTRYTRKVCRGKTYWVRYSSSRISVSAPHGMRRRKNGSSQSWM